MVAMFGLGFLCASLLHSGNDSLLQSANERTDRAIKQARETLNTANDAMEVSKHWEQLYNRCIAIVERRT
jgi:hypothetical protein